MKALQVVIDSSVEKEGARGYPKDYLGESDCGRLKSLSVGVGSLQKAQRVSVSLLYRHHQERHFNISSEGYSLM